MTKPNTFLTSNSRSPTSNHSPQSLSTAALRRCVRFFFLFFSITALGAELEVDEAGIRQLVEHYFEVWTMQDMKGYSECFVPDAVITYVDSRGRLTTLERNRFVETQARAHQQSPVPMREVPEDIQIKQDGDMAMALVRWRLMKKDDSVRGVDAFTLMKTGEGWRIIYLAFKMDEIPINSRN